MFELARRFRVLAALGLVLALAHGRARGETIWTKVAHQLRTIGDWPGVLPPLSPKLDFTTEALPAPKKPEASPPPLFFWENKDAADKAFGLGRFCELVGDYEWAYLRYHALARRYPSRREFVAAVARAKAKEPTPAPCWGLWFVGGWDSSCPWFADSKGAAFVMPERKDMLPDSERSDVLIEFGIIDSPAALLSTGDRVGFGMGIIF